VTVEEYIKAATAEIGEKISIRRFVKYNLGEGMEKRNEDFAAEVEAQTRRSRTRSPRRSRRRRSRRRRKPPPPRRPPRTSRPSRSRSSATNPARA
jgi:elongation factor Ts